MRRSWVGRFAFLQQSWPLLVAAVALLASLPSTGIVCSVARATDDKEKRSGISKEDYLKTYLTADDLPGWKRVQDSRTRGADRGDKTYVKLGGVHSGLAAWMRNKRPYSRIVDLRWVFPSSAAAKAYLRDQLPVMAERLPVVQNAPKVGEESHTFGGAQEVLEQKFRSYIIVFRQDNVVVKFFQYESGADSELRPLKMAPLCRAILQHIKAVAR